MAIRTLLAGDHALMREGLRMMLGAAGGITVVGEAADGREAVKKVRELSPDVVVMDISMPGLNGIEATQQILEIAPDTQVVILSIHADAEDIARALQAGVLGYVLKESAAKEVIAAIRCAHEGKRYLSQKITVAVVDDYLRQMRAGWHKTPLEMLSPREREVLQLVVEGKTSAEIAMTIHLSPKTVETYRSRLMHKLGISDLPSLVKFAIQHGLTSSD